MAKSKCSKGSIRRKGYIRKTKKGSVKVGSRCIKAVSQSGLKRSSIDKKIMQKRASIHKQARQKYGTPKCGSRQIMREGYYRKSYSRKSGSRVSGSWVAPTCIEDVGNSGKRQQLFRLEKGTLSQYGYRVESNATERRKALTRAVNSGLKPLSAFRKLIALRTLTQNTNPEMSRIVGNDAEWLRNSSMYQLQRGSKKGSKK